MENASKALIIAGAVVLAILIIGLGMYFYNQANANTKGFTLTDYEIKNINSKFSMYEGKMDSTRALELLETVVTYNTSVGTDNYGVLFAYDYAKHKPNETAVYLKDEDIFNKYDSLIDLGKANGTSTIEGLNDVTGSKINAFLYGTISGEAFYTDYKNAFKNTTDNFVCVCQYSKDSGLLRGIIVYNADKNAK